MRSVEDSIRTGRVRLKRPDEDRNRHQSVTLLDAISEFGFDACFGGARRDEEKARAKERIFSFRDEFGQWDPKNQRPELWSLYNTRVHPGENMRVFPISNWTELDIWQYIAREKLAAAVALLRAHAQARRAQRHAACRCPHLVLPKEGEEVVEKRVRFRTLGDVTCTCPVLSEADTYEKIVEETIAAKHTERGRHAPGRPDLGRLDGAAQKGRVFLMSAQTLLRFSTAGSVDDGKSTLIGRLLFDSRSVLEDQVATLARTTERRGGKGPRPGAPDRRPRRRARAGHHDRRRLPLLRDQEAQVHHRRHPGPRAVHPQHGDRRLDGRSHDRADRREEGRAAAVAPPRRGREPARHPAPRRRRQQDGRGRLLRRSASKRSRRSSPAVIAKLEFQHVHFVPVSALEGDMTVARGNNLPWYTGPALLELLETVEVAKPTNAPLRFPVQYVAMPGMPGTFHRGYMGRIESGEIKKGDACWCSRAGSRRRSRTS